MIPTKLTTPGVVEGAAAAKPTAAHMTAKITTSTKAAATAATAAAATQGVTGQADSNPQQQRAEQGAAHLNSS
jgi:hypothetical protein